MEEIMKAISKKVPAFIVSLVIVTTCMFACLFATAQTAYADDSVPTPTGLKWGSEYIDTMAVWDWLAPYEDEEGVYEDVDHYEGTVTWTSTDGADTAPSLPAAVLVRPAFPAAFCSSSFF